MCNNGAVVYSTGPVNTYLDTCCVVPRGPGSRASLGIPHYVFQKILELLRKIYHKTRMILTRPTPV
jgi:hypothetical protein